MNHPPAPSQAAHPPSPALNLAHQLLATVAALIAVLEQEMPMLAKRDFTLYPPLLTRKQQLGADYQRLMTQLAAMPTLRQQLDVTLYETLRHKGEQLQALAMRNAEALRLAHKASERLLRAIMLEVRRTIHQQSLYTGQGGFLAARAVVAPAVAYSRQI